MNAPATLPPLTMAIRLGLACLVGLAVGVEREWSAPSSRPRRRFAGLRTFLMFGAIGGTSGLLIALGQPLPAAALAAAAGAFIVAAYVLGARRFERLIDGTTEAAAFVVIGLGILAGLGYLDVAAGCVAVVVFALGEKERLHWLVRRIGPTEMHATLQFLVLALVVMPLLPTGPVQLLSWTIRPRLLWATVVVLSGLNFAGYIARRAIGPARGYGLTGLLGGIVSSTAVTLQFARLSRSEPEQSAALSLGAVAACCVVPVRVIVVGTALNSALVESFAPTLAAMLVAGVAFLTIAFRRRSEQVTSQVETRSPLRLGSALQMALLFQVALIAVDYARAIWGSAGLVSTGVLLGIADADALTVAMSRVATTPTLVATATRAMVAGIAATTVFKSAIALVVGSPAFGRRTAGVLLVMAAALGAAAWWNLLR